jgi:hypothetical protein
MLKKLRLITLTILLVNIPLSAQFKFMGIVTDSLSSEPVQSAKVEIFGTGKVKFTDNTGLFSFENLSQGLYTITFSKQDYLSSIKTFVIDSVSSGENVSILLSRFEPATDTIDVNAKYFKKTDDVNTSFMNVEYEEIRKSPGALEDVIRYFTGAPGVSMGNDINNEIIIRGGSPVENLTLIDGLEVQNPNHYGAPGSTNGVLSYINLKLVKDVNFFSGGFPPEYGDRVSGVMDIRFKEGNRHSHRRDINISATGFGGFFEGPVTEKSSYMFSVRRSYYEFIKEYLKTVLVPEYWDFNTKLNYDLSKTDKISLTGLFATDNAKPYEKGDYMYDTINVKMLSAGINYSKVGEKFVFKFITGYSWSFYKVNYQDFVLDINDNILSLRQEVDYKINKNFSMNVFSGAKYFFSKYKVRHGSGFNASNYYTPSVSFNDDVNTFKYSGGINLTSYFFKGKLILNTGVRFDSFQLINDKLSISPRIGVSYKITPVTLINANAGIYYQSPEMLWVLVDPANRKLDYIRVDELVLGTEHYFSSDIKLIVEPYLKQYYNYPVSVYDPNFIFINSGVEIYPNFLDKAISSGKGYFTGVDVTFQKKNSGKGLYWTLAYSFSKSKFLALAGDIQPAEFDYGNQMTIIAGYKFPFGLSLSSRFKFAKGRPYTPYNYDLSVLYNRGIYDKSLYNKARMPDYARLDLRVDQQFTFGKSLLVIYIELINVLNRVNYYNFYWSSFYKTLRSNLQFPRVPILGLSFQF